MSPKLVLYSDQISPLTDAVDARLLELLPAPPVTIGYIPSAPDRKRLWFRQRIEYYARLGISLHYFGLEEEFEATELAQLFSLPAIHLSGGNTFRFLHWLRTRGLLSELQRYVADGGVLIGLSAGAIMMTRDVGCSAICGDAPYPSLTDNTGLGLVDFTVLPHFDGSATQYAALEQLAASFGSHAYGVPDGAGIVVEGSRVELIGAIVQC